MIASRRRLNGQQAVHLHAMIAASPDGRAFFYKWRPEAKRRIFTTTNMAASRLILGHNRTLPFTRIMVYVVPFAVDVRCGTRPITLHDGDPTEPMYLFGRPGTAADCHHQILFEPEASP